MPFDVNRFTIERMQMAHRIQLLQHKYQLSAIEFVYILTELSEIIRLSLMDDNNYFRNRIPKTMTLCEDILFEIYARICKSQEVINWIIDKIVEKFPDHLNRDSSHYYLITENINIIRGQNPEQPLTGLDIFHIYETINRRINVGNIENPNVTIPAFSAIMALKEMNSDQALIYNRRNTNNQYSPPGGG